MISQSHWSLPMLTMCCQGLLEQMKMTEAGTFAIAATCWHYSKGMLLTGYISISCVSLVSRPHTLTRVNSLVNHVKFFGLVTLFVTVQTSTVQNISISRKVRILNCKKNFTVEVLRKNYSSYNLIGPYHFWVINPT